MLYILLGKILNGGELIVPVLGAGDLGSGLFTPLQLTVQNIISAVPWLIFALIVLIIGVFVAVILGHALRIILDKFKVDAWLRKAHLTQEVALLNLGALSETISRFVSWLPSLLVAVVIFLIGLAAAHYVELKIAEHTKLKGMKLSGKILKLIILILVAIQALDR